MGTPLAQLPWHRRDPQQLEVLKQDLATAFATLRVIETDATVFVRGTFPLEFEGLVLDRYAIEIELPSDYPGSPPLVREAAGRIPRIPDRHVNDQDGTLCVALPDELWLKSLNGFPLLEFLTGPLHQYLLGNSLVERGEPYPFGELSHGSLGIIEFYGELLGTTSREAIVRLLTMATKKKVKPHWDCPCGSRRAMRDCHRALLRRLQQHIPRDVLKQSLQRVKSSP